MALPVLSINYLSSVAALLRLMAVSATHAVMGGENAHLKRNRSDLSDLSDLEIHPDDLSIDPDL